MSQRFDLFAIRRVLNYHEFALCQKVNRAISPSVEMLDREETWRRVVELDKHTHSSFEWTFQQSKFVEAHGWGAWFASDAPLGPKRKRKEKGKSSEKQ